jgi:mannose-6-phosphate isomerase-like protein (cupin superfamily)
MESYWFFDQLFDVLIGGEQTGGSYSLCELWAPSGCQSPLHVHNELDEGWYVIGGELTVWVGDDDVHVLGPGKYAHAPRGVPHTIEVTGSNELHALITTLPAGFEEYVRSFGRPAQEHRLPVLEGPPDIALAAELAVQHGIELLGPPGMKPAALKSR